MDAAPTLPVRPALIALGAVVALEAAARPLLPEAAVTRMAMTGALRAVEVVGLIWYVSGLPQGMAAIGLSRERWRLGIRSGLLWSAVFAIAAVIAAAIAIYGFSADPIQFIRAQLPRGLFARGTFILVAGLVSPVAEELVFRGVLFSLLHRWGATAAIVGSALLFTAAHLPQGFPLIQCVGGLVFACAIEKSRSLLSPLVIHILGNLAIYSLSIFLQ